MTKQDGQPLWRRLQLTGSGLQVTQSELKATRSKLQADSMARRRSSLTGSATGPFKGGSAPCIGMLLMGLCCGLAVIHLSEARITFEKMTNRDYTGLAYYTIQNVSLFECLGWCKEEASCTSAVFSFVVNPFAALQETTCSLQNETQARQGAYMRQLPNGEQATIVAQPQKAINLYFFNKIELQTETVCSRLWAFERFPNRKLRQRDRQSFHAPTKEACQAACMNEQRFVCRSLEYNYISQQCSLSAHDRRSPLILHLSSGGGGADLIETPGSDYFENACLLGEDICNESRIYDYARMGLPLSRVAHFVELNYYPDKEMLVKSQAGCVRACTIEHEFICRSILYRSSFKQGQPNCALYHLDQRTFPDGADTFMSHVMQPLLDSGETSAVYLEAICNESISLSSNVGPSTQASLILGGSGGTTGSQQVQLGGSTITMPPTSISIMASSTTPGAISVHPGTPAGLHLGGGPGGHHGHHQLERNHSQGSSSSSSSSDFLSASSTLSPLATLATLASSSSAPPTTIRLPGNFLPGNSGPSPPGNIQIDVQPTPGRPLVGLPAHLTIGPAGSLGATTPSGLHHQIQAHLHRQPQGGGGGGSMSSASSIQIPTHLVISPAPPTRENPFSSTGYDASNGSNIAPSNIHITGSALGALGSSNRDQNCDAHGFCYDVSLKCTDTKMVVNVRTERPFFGRIYALGRSETCNANIKNQNQFQLDMYLTGQECNTQSASGTYTNTIVLQHHNVVLTKADKVYHVRCTYETASRNVSFGMMPVKDMFEVDVNDRNQETISITASSDAPLPKISILTLDGKEASTVRIGDRLTFKIEIPDNTPYGIFARSCIAMAKDARSTFEIIDENGCPVDHTIFPNFLPSNNGNTLESNYEAFRFTESYGVIFQCNVKYCIGKCEPVHCGIGRDSVESWGRKKRSVNDQQVDKKSKQVGDDMTLSREILVLDLKEKDIGSGTPDQDSSDSSEASVTPPTAAASQLSSGPKQRQGGSTRSQTGDSAGNDSLPDLSGKHCITDQSLLVLICSIAFFFLLYVGLVAFLFSFRKTKISTIKHQFH